MGDGTRFEYAHQNVVTRKLVDKGFAKAIKRQNEEAVCFAWDTWCAVVRKEKIQRHLAMAKRIKEETEERAQAAALEQRGGLSKQSAGSNRFRVHSYYSN